MKIYDYNGKKNICGDRLREARVVQRLRQEDLAAKIQTMGVNMERDSISRIEIGTLTYCNKYVIINTSKGGEENGARHRKSLAGAFKSD